ncbi:hypothetical protein EXIGLDRAFT_839864 [Exidia glandulosa HHB12029]|uniref:DUF6535 domain-containing protein n=1 Tax=Exidia glandulosa HHB12029 TaxID=1314781 RepID=A0A166A114_EXIGL|nr:hypothetical protein EXIGLDRAFT_839864 [Exidia glandulosa HHB12029]
MCAGPTTERGVGDKTIHDIDIMPAASLDSLSAVAPEGQVPPLRQTYAAEQLDTEFKRKYPPDPFGEEMAPNARVWKVYRDEATIQDEAMLDGWNKTLDILLIFAGLFSAVATAFIVESYKAFQPDFAEYTARALFILMSARNGSGTMDPLPALPDPGVVIVSTQTRWINGLWFTSLSLSLGVALLCILVKQWLGQYKDRITASTESPQSWARRRALYHEGIKRWQLPAFIAVLPLLLHIALFLFLGGLVTLIWDLDTTIAVIMATLTAVLSTFYTICLVLPQWYVDSPTATPLAEQMGNILPSLRRAALGVAHLILDICFTWDTGLYRRRLVRAASSTKASVQKSVRAFASYNPRDTWRRWAAVILSLPGHLRLFHADPEILEHLVNYRRERARFRERRELTGRLDAAIIRWMTSDCSLPDIDIVAFEATAALHPASRAAELLGESGHTLFSAAAGNAVDVAGRAAAVARRFKAYLCCMPGRDLDGYTVDWLGITSDAMTLDDYDIPILSTLLNGGFTRISNDALRDYLLSVHAAEIRQPAPFLTSTGLQVLKFLGVSLSNRILIVGCLDFQLLAAEDLEQVTRTILTQISCRDHDGHAQLDPSCAVNLFCGLATNPDDHGLDETCRRVITSIILQFQIPLDSLRGQYASLHCSMETYLIWLTSHLDEMHSWQPSDVLKVASMVRIVVGNAHRLRLRTPTKDLNLIAITVRLFECAQKIRHRQQSDWYNIVTFTSTIPFIAFFADNEPSTSHDWAAAGLRQHPVAPIQLPLNSTSARASEIAQYLVEAINNGPLGLLTRRDGKGSLWQFVTEAWVEHGEHHRSWIALAHLLATHLCVYSRRYRAEIEDITDEFFAYGWEKRLAVIIDTTVHSDFLRHCIELRPNWWPSMLAHIEALEDTAGNMLPEAKACARQIQAKVVGGKMGPCMKCPS